MTDENYWLNRWVEGRTGWHQTEVEPALEAAFAGLRPTRVLVPLCGKSLDLLWLARRGHDVVGIELSPLACGAFFSENGLPCELETSNGITVYRGGGVTILNANVFAVSATRLGTLGALYDRAALIALPPPVRRGYAAHVTALARACATRPGFRFLQILLERRPHDENGPPFSVSRAELDALYGGAFDVRAISREAVEPDNASAASAVTDECVYELGLRS